MIIEKIRSQLKIIKATLSDYPIIQQMWPFYIYDMGRYCGWNQDWECPANLTFIADDLTSYFKNPNQALLIKIKDELAGFILLNKVDTTTMNWNMGEFFILAKFQGKGIGQWVAHELWRTHQGSWEVSVIPENKPALIFWRKAISTFSNSDYTEEVKVLGSEKHPSQRIIFRFNTNQNDSSSVMEKNDSIKIRFVDSLSEVLEKRLTEGFAAYEAQHGIDVNYRRFSMVLTNEKNEDCGVINAYTAFSEIYVDDIWVDSAHRGKGYGKKLLEALELHFKGQGFNNINLCTSDFQAVEFYKKCGFTEEFTRINRLNPQFTKTFFVKFFAEDMQTQGLLKRLV